MHWFIIALVLALGLLWIHYAYTKSKAERSIRTDNYEGWTILIVIILAGFNLMWWGGYYNSRSFVTEFESARDTITDARLLPDISAIERQGLTEVIIKQNTGLAEQKYDNQNWFFHLATTDEVDALEPLK